MSGIYIYSDNTALVPELVGFAKSIGKEAHVLTFAAADAAQVENCGATQVILMQGGNALVESNAAAVADYLKVQAAEMLLVGATARGRDFAARVAGYLDCAMVSDVTSLAFASGKWQTQRMMYGGAVMENSETEGLCVVTVGAGKFVAATGAAAQVTVDIICDDRCKLISTSPVQKTGVDLSVADRVVCVGMGVNSADDLGMVGELADKLDAEIACSRGVAEERKWLPIEKYIGISGAVLKAQIYLSLGVSGQVQHLVGIRDVKNVIAINTNESAPIFRAADYGIVGDLYEIVPLLMKAL